MGRNYVGIVDSREAAIIVRKETAEMTNTTADSEDSAEEWLIYVYYHRQ